MVGNSSNSVKEDNMEDIERHHIEMDEGEFSDGLPYKPSLMDHSANNQESEDFFAGYLMKTAQVTVDAEETNRNGVSSSANIGTDGDTGGGKEERLLQVEECQGLWLTALHVVVVVVLGGGTKVRCGGIWAMVFGCDDGGGWSSRGVWVHLVWSDSVGWSRQDAV
ncbi:hypothetical protein JHK87_047769 [Glycine soja]|nr:hypothetical protein JHK87_047769 [Glycine soja]